MTLQLEERHVFKDCCEIYENLTESFHEKFLRSFLISGSFCNGAMSVSKSINNLFTLFSPVFIKQIFSEDVSVSISCIDNEQTRYISEIKKVQINPSDPSDWGLFLISRSFKYGSDSFLFNIYLLKGSLNSMNRHWLYF